MAIKVAVLLLLAFALYKQLYQNEDVLQIPKLLQDRTGGNTFFILVILILLMFLNWGIEDYKLKPLIQKLNPIRFIRTFKAVWTGVTL